MRRPGSVALYVLEMVFITAIPALMAQKSSNRTDPDNKSLIWETKLEFLLKLGQYAEHNGSLLADLIGTFSDPHKADIQRLVDQSLPELRSLYSDAPLPTQLENYKRLYIAKASNGSEAVNMSLPAILRDIVTECERLYVTLSNSSDIKETFLYGVPLAFVHLAALRETFASSEGALKEKIRKDIVTWLVTYWQFVYDGYTRWEMSRTRGLKWVANMGMNSCYVRFSNTLPRGSQLSWQISQCDPDSSEWLSSQMNLARTAYSSQLQFEMMASISKMFLLHQLVPGYDSSNLYLGNFSNTLQLGPIQPLSYQFVPNATVEDSVSNLEPTCQPLMNSQLKGITSFTVRQWDWVDGVQVQYENGLDDFQGNKRGGTAETMSFDPHNREKCLSSITWNLSSRLNRLTSITVAARDGTSAGFLGNRKKTADVTLYTTAPMLYCISRVAVCAVTSIKSDNIPAVTGFLVEFEIVNASSTMPEPLVEGFKLLQERTELGAPNGINGSRDHEAANNATSQLPVRQKQEPQREPPITQVINNASSAINESRAKINFEHERLQQNEPQREQLLSEVKKNASVAVNESRANRSTAPQRLQQKQEPQREKQPDQVNEDNQKQMERMQAEMEVIRKKNEEEQRQMEEKYLKMKTDLEESRQRFEAQEEESKRRMKAIEEQKGREDREREQRQNEITEATNNVRSLQNQLNDAEDSLRQWQEKASEGLGFFEGLGRIVTIGYYDPRYKAKENVKMYQGTVDYLTKKLSDAQDRVNRLI